MGAQLAGGVSLGLYEQQTPEQLRHILAHSGARVVFVAGAAELATVIAAADATCRVEAIVPWWDDALAAETGPNRACARRRDDRLKRGGERRRRARARRARATTRPSTCTRRARRAPECVSHGNVLGASAP